jgi:hypothetical protein
MDPRISKQRTALVLDQPFFGVLALRLKVVEDPLCKTFWTDGESLGYNPAYLGGLNDLQTRGVLAHEILHVANGHCWRQGFPEWMPISACTELRAEYAAGALVAPPALASRRGLKGGATLPRHPRCAAAHRPTARVSGAHHALANSSASFDLRVRTAGAYNVSLWWPAAVPARASWASAMRVTISPGAVQATLDLTRQGGDVFLLVAANAQLAPGSTLLVECPAGGGDCIADAVLVESAARYNDGSAAAQVTLQPMDAIVLRREAPGC